MSDIDLTVYDSCNSNPVSHLHDAVAITPNSN